MRRLTAVILLISILTLKGATYETEKETSSKEIHNTSISYYPSGLRTVEEGTGQVPRSLASRKAFIPEQQAINRPLQIAICELEGRKSSSLTVSRGGNDRYRYIGIFKVTAYTANYESTGKRPDDPGYGITATGTKVTEDRTIAADFKVLPPRTKVKIKGLSNTYTVEDCGGAVKGKHIDLYIPSLKDAKDWGVRHLEISILEMGDPYNGN